MENQFVRSLSRHHLGSPNALRWPSEDAAEPQD